VNCAFPVTRVQSAPFTENHTSFFLTLSWSLPPITHIFAPPPWSKTHDPILYLAGNSAADVACCQKLPLDEYHTSFIALPFIPPMSHIILL